MTIDPVTPHINFKALESEHCRFPYGDPRSESFHYCGHPKAGKQPYCEGHARIAYQSAAPRMRSGELERELAKAG